MKNNEKIIVITLSVIFLTIFFVMVWDLYIRENPSNNKTGITDTVNKVNESVSNENQSTTTSKTNITSKTVSSTFTANSDFGGDGSELPVEYTCDGAGISPAISWKNVPSGTKSFAVIMSTIPVDGGVKYGWVLFNIPATVTGLAKNNTTIGISGTGSHGSTLGYQSPCSQGPGDKVYTFTVYALSETPKFSVQSSQVTGDILLKAISSITLGSSTLNFTHARE